MKDTDYAKEVAHPLAPTPESYCNAGMSHNPGRYSQVQGDAQREREERHRIETEGMPKAQALRYLIEVYTDYDPSEGMVMRGSPIDATKYPGWKVRAAWKAMRRHYRMPV